MGMGIEFIKNIGKLELDLQFLLNFSHEWKLEWELPWFLDQLLISEFNITPIIIISLLQELH
jgi:hypothetical protein